MILDVLVSINLAKLNYKNLGHISNILWHFKGPHHTSDSARPPIIDRLESYLHANTKGGYLEPYTKNGKFYERQLVFPSSPLGQPNSADFEIYEVREPKAVCFCDISVSHLASHINKYGDVGLGFHRKALVDKVSDLRPVKYQPIKELSDLKKFATKDWKFEPLKKEILLDEYVKIPTLLDQTDLMQRGQQSEHFEDIYEEREWRSFERFDFSVEDLAFVVLPKRGLVHSQKHPKLTALLTSGVGVVYAMELFGGSDR